MEINDVLNKKLSSGREYRNTQPLLVKDDEKKVRGYATTFNEPYLLWSFDEYRVYEQIDPHAFDECDMSDVIMQYDHEGRVFARLSNNTLALNVDDHGLEIEADLGGTELGRDLYEEIKGGYTNKMSFGFKVAEDKREETVDHENNIITVTRTITKISKLYDVSAVSLPANDATEISARSFADGVIEEVKKEILAKEQREKLKQKIRILSEVK